MIDANQITIDIRSALQQAFQRLRRAEVPSHTLSAELLLMHVSGKDRAWLYAHPEEQLDRAIAGEYVELVERRCTGVPTQYLTGKQEFWGLEFEVSPAVLIPRPETEHVVEVALERLGHRERRLSRPPDARSMADGAGLTVADVGTGSGCIAIALARELAHATFYATDSSSAALEVARRNASRHAVADRMQFVQCHLLTGIPCRSLVTQPAGEPSGCSGRELSGMSRRYRDLDLIVSNPPYIGRAERDGLQREIRDHEPETALYAGDQGTELYAPLIRDSAARLSPGGIVVLELGHNSVPVVRPLLEDSNWTDLVITNDLAGIPRVLAAERL
ncbi:MAG TPA: peptide chain release factor N(5)-glutamine methyltransferase [Candidatus Dormibacteraeota bacterium]|nr:peptide chain release factor N(5)-glutamine methyltransferase [Candidatus Dormibacteraeota bacterium]